jgi:hypothetical protein
MARIYRKPYQPNRSDLDIMHPPITVISGCHKEDYLPNIFRNFNRQTYFHKKLILVLNGEAADTKLPMDIDQNQIHFIRWYGETGPAEAKNVALEYLRSCNFNGVWATMDADDAYMPGYITEIASSAHKADAIGKISYFVLLDRRLMLIKGIENDYCEFVIGPTISCWMDATPKYGFPQPKGKVGEDACFLHGLLDAGKTIYSTSRFNMCYSRRENDPNHVWKINHDKFIENNKDVIIDLGSPTQEEFWRAVNGSPL